MTGWTCGRCGKPVAGRFAVCECGYGPEAAAARPADAAALPIPQRETTHGDFARCAQIAEDLMRIMHHAGPPAMGSPQRLALRMIAVKIARILAGDPSHLDHWRDIAGYAELGAAACGKDR